MSFPSPVTLHRPTINNYNITTALELIIQKRLNILLLQLLTRLFLFIANTNKTRSSVYYLTPCIIFFNDSKNTFGGTNTQETNENTNYKINITIFLFFFFFRSRYSFFSFKYFFFFFLAYKY